MDLTGKEHIKIAVTYDNGEIFQHFGQTTRFKFYEVVNGELVGSEIVGTGNYTHCSLGTFLFESGINVLICGGLGGGASRALLAAGILVYAGNSGSADEAVQKLLRRELLYDPYANCHHDHGEHGCHHEADHECAGHNHYDGGHNHKNENDVGHNHHR